MDPFSRMSELANDVDEATFVARYPGLYLLGRFPARERDQWSFHTNVINTGKMMRRAPSWDEAEPVSDEGHFVRPVAKRAGNEWRGRISIGRATSNDVVIRHPSVSKLHAHLHVAGDDPDGPVRRPTDLELVDVNSANGTLVDGRAVLDEERVRLRSGVRLTFGEVECRLVDASRLYQELRVLTSGF